MLQSFSVSIQLRRCPFCGTVFLEEGSNDSPERHGCLAGEPPQRFKVGQRVYATFRVGAGMSLVGHVRLLAEVTAVSKPQVWETGVGKFDIIAPYGSPCLRASIFKAPHEWVYTVRRLEEREGTFDSEQLPESELQEANEVEAGVQIGTD